MGSKKILLNLRVGLFLCVMLRTEAFYKFIICLKFKMHEKLF